MGVQIVINKDLFEACPSLMDVQHSLDNIPLDETIEIRWGNSGLEHVTLKHHENRKFLLYVPDLQSSERAVATLEVPLTLDKNLIGSALTALTNMKLYNWRDFSREMGAAVTKNLVLKIAADDIRNGRPSKLAYVAKDVLLDGITPSNADTLLRLRHLRGY